MPCCKLHVASARTLSNEKLLFCCCSTHLDGTKHVLLQYLHSCQLLSYSMVAGMLCNCLQLGLHFLQVLNQLL